jgi:ankyrin repeat protein
MKGTQLSPDAVVGMTPGHLQVERRDEHIFCHTYPTRAPVSPVQMPPATIAFTSEPESLPAAVSNAEPQLLAHFGFDPAARYAELDAAGQQEVNEALRILRGSSNEAALDPQTTLWSSLATAFATGDSAWVEAAVTLMRLGLVDLKAHPDRVGGLIDDVLGSWQPDRASYSYREADDFERGGILARLRRLDTVDMLAYSIEAADREAGSVPPPLSKESPTTWLTARDRLALLFEHGADPDWRHDVDGRTLVERAIDERQPELLLMLLTHGANPWVRDAQGINAFERVFAARDREIWRVIAAHVGADLDMALPRRCTPFECLLEFLLQVPEVDTRMDDRSTLLHNVTHAKAASLLIACGADVNARALYGGTPLHSARSAEITRVLLHAGADANATDWSHYTPLYTARSVAQARMLVEAGADPNNRSHGLWELAMQVNPNKEVRRWLSTVTTAGRI